MTTTDALPTTDELAATVAEHLDSDIRLLVLAAGVTQTQFENQFHGILEAVSRRAAAAALNELKSRSADSGWTVVADNGGEYINSDLMEKGDRVTFILETKRRTRIIRIERPTAAAAGTN
jgi:hypothetical protein